MDILKGINNKETMKDNNKETMKYTNKTMQTKLQSLQFIFLDTPNKSMWTTEDGTNSLLQHTLSFHPSVILFHPTEWKTIAALEVTTNGEFNVHISTDFAKSWKASMSNVVSFHWWVALGFLGVFGAGGGGIVHLGRTRVF